MTKRTVRRTRDKDVNKWLLAAKQRLTTAEFLAEHRMYLDCIYLAGYCPECVLKAIIVSRLPKRRRQDYVQQRFRSVRGHSYEYLKERLARDFGVQLPVDIARLLRRVAWSTDLRCEVGRKPAREAEAFLDMCHQVSGEKRMCDGTTTEARTADALKTDETRRIERKLRRFFPRTDAYRFNSASIRIRIVDERFAGKSNPEREDLVNPHVQELSEDTQADITVLLLLTPAEAKSSLMNLEFEAPSPSRL